MHEVNSFNYIIIYYKLKHIRCKLNIAYPYMIDQLILLYHGNINPSCVTHVHMMLQYPCDPCGKHCPILTTWGGFSIIDF